MSSVFAKIIDGELPAEKIFENDKFLVIKDIKPAAPVHLLIIPKKEIPDLQSLKDEDMDLVKDVVQIAKNLALQFNITEGYRLLTNNGPLAGQTIFHLHFHLIGGRTLGALA